MDDHRWEWYKKGMNSDTIICPNCKAEVEVTEVLAAQLRADIQRQSPEMD